MMGKQAVVVGEVYPGFGGQCGGQLGDEKSAGLQICTVAGFPVRGEDSTTRIHVHIAWEHLKALHVGYHTQG